MKKLHLISVSLLFAALCLAFTACNQSLTAGQGTGTVRIVIENGATRAVNADGMPQFDGDNTVITVTGEDGNQLAEGKTSVTLQVAAGKKIIVTAVVKTVVGEWRGVAEHTVTEGTNTVAVKLSKAPKSVGNILIDVGGSTQDSCTLKVGSKPLVSNAWINTHHGIYPITARDKIGRIYCLYKDVSSPPATRHFKRFDVEGTEDTEFERTFMNILSSHSSTGVTIDNIDTIAIDEKNNNMFLFYGGQVVCINETEPSAFGHFLMPSLDSSISSISAAAAYNGTLFFAVPSTVALPTVYKLFACKAELSGTTLRFENMGNPQSIDQLRTDPAFNQYRTECKGLFADESGVYCLLAQKDYHNYQAVGKLIRYEYSDSGLTQKAEIGLNTKTPTTAPNFNYILTVDADYFSYPVGFIGSDEENIYIADDGANFEYTHENIHSIGNRNRIVAVNRKTDGLTFSNTDATWYAEFPEYKEPDTKVLLWEKDFITDPTIIPPPSYPAYEGMRYWASTDGTEAFSETNKLWEEAHASSKVSTDMFCYDQDGNLYILWQDGSNYSVRCFELKNGTSYAATGDDSPAMGSVSSLISCIAVDISGEQNYLYCGYKDGTDLKVKQMAWVGNVTTLAASHPVWTITVGSASDEELTALVANKDGIFVAVKKEYPVGTAQKYRLKVQKYKKTDGSPDGAITIVNDAPLYTYVAGGAIDDLSTVTTALKPYIECKETINGLQVVDGVLYAIASRITKTMKYTGSSHVPDEFRSKGVLYKVGQTAHTFTGSYDKEFIKEFSNPLPSDPSGTKGTSYGFYRFIAVKPKKLVIASDSAWGTGGGYPGGNYRDTDKVVEYDLAGQLQSDNNSGGGFSKILTQDLCQFVWQ